MGDTAEKNIINGLLLHPEYIAQISTIIDPEMFISSIRGRLFYEYRRAFKENYFVDVAILQSRVVGDFQDWEFTQTITDCMTSDIITEKQVIADAQAVRSDFKVRQISKCLEQTRFSGGDIDKQVEALIGTLESFIDNDDSESKAMPQIVDLYSDLYFTPRSADGKTELGFPLLDDSISGIEGGDLVLIGARPAVGKSAFAAQIAGGFIDKGYKVAYYNLEMDERQLYERFLAMKSGIPLSRIRTAEGYERDEEERHAKANAELREYGKLIITTGGRKVSDIRRETKGKGFDAIIVDYLQLVTSEGTYKGNRFAEVGEISRNLKLLAMDLKIPIIALTQLNRVSEGREDKEPTMGEIRESGNLEQDASVIILMWNKKGKDDNDRTIKGVKIEKARQGKTGRFEFKFNGNLMRFEELGNPFAAQQPTETEQPQDEAEPEQMSIDSTATATPFDGMDGG